MNSINKNLDFIFNQRFQLICVGFANLRWFVVVYFSESELLTDLDKQSTTSPEKCQKIHMIQNIKSGNVLTLSRSRAEKKYEGS